MNKLKRFFFKTVKILIISYCVLLLASPFFAGCLSFRLTQKEIDIAFKGLKEKPTQHQVQTEGHTINYAEIGNDSLPVAFFVHGSPGSWSAFIDFMKDTQLVSRVKMVSVDRPGFGYSDFGEGEGSLEKQARYIRPVIEKYKVSGKKLILIGHSLGGPLIARMAMDYPQLVDHLIIVAGSISPALEPNEKWFRIPLNFTPLRILIPKSFRASNKELLYLRPELEKMMPLWKNIKMPVTIIQGGSDILVDPKNAAFAKEMLVNAKMNLVWVDSMNHFVPWSHPWLIKQAILNALSDHY